MKTKFLNTVIVVLLSALAIAGCNKEKEDLYEFDGYIVGFVPCTVQYHYRIGYEIISSNLKDTLVTYNLSDEKFQMPASVIGSSGETLYKIPESFFQASSSRYELKIKGTFRFAKDNEVPTHLCADYLAINYKTVIFTIATK